MRLLTAQAPGLALKSAKADWDMQAIGSLIDRVERSSLDEGLYRRRNDATAHSSSARLSAEVR